MLKSLKHFVEACGIVVMYLHFRPSDHGRLPVLTINMNKILKLWGHSYRRSMTIADPRIVAEAKMKTNDCQNAGRIGLLMC